MKFKSALRAVRSVRIFFDARKLRTLVMLWRENDLRTAFGYMFSNELRKKKPYRLKVCGEIIHIRTSSSDLAVARSSLGGEFEPLRSAYPRSHKGLIIDAGAYIGTSAIALSNMYPEATIVSIEPSSDNLSMLRMNVAGRKNIHVENAALTSASNQQNVQLRNRGTGDWGFTIIEQPQDRQATFIEDVPAVSVEALMEKYGFSDVMILKMDIEGAEYGLFRESGWLALTKVLMVELHERIVTGIESSFQAANSDRYVYKSDGEKYISVGRRFFG